MESLTEQQLQAIDVAISKGIETHVNGKIKRLREEQEIAHAELDKKIDRIESSTLELLEVFKETSTFFKVIIKISRFIIPVGGAFGIIWGFIKFLK